MRFAKYEGIGNDFILVWDPGESLEIGPGLAAALCDRRRGIGADGVIRIVPGGDDVDVSMDYRNADGSPSAMCGNGIRCVALFARDESLLAGDVARIGTQAGVKTVDIGSPGTIRVDMGPPAFAPDSVPVVWDAADALHVRLDSDLGPVELACLSMGNPHAVLFVGDPETAPVGSLGPVLERHPAFPDGVNVEFARVVGPDKLSVRVWERGSGETAACGTGACAAAVAARMVHGCEESVVVELPGGSLEIEWHGTNTEPASVFMTGPARRNFSGEVDIDAYRRRAEVMDH